MELKELAGVLESVKVLSLQPNDSLIFRCSETLSDEQASRVREVIERQIPAAAGRVLIVPPQFTLEVVRAEMAEAR